MNFNSTLRRIILAKEAEKVDFGGEIDYFYKYNPDIAHKQKLKNHADRIKSQMIDGLLSGELCGVKGYHDLDYNYEVLPEIHDDQEVLHKAKGLIGELNRYLEKENLLVASYCFGITTDTATGDVRRTLQFQIKVKPEFVKSIRDSLGELHGPETNIIRKYLAGEKGSFAQNREKYIERDPR